jgi:hypothetical protein
MITEVVPGKKIVTAIDFEKMDDNTAEFSFAEEKKSVVVTWSMVHNIGNNPIRKYGALFQKGAMRKVFDKGLTNIKIKTEQR